MRNRSSDDDLFLRLSKNLRLRVKKQSSGGVCRGQRAPYTFKSMHFLNLFVQKMLLEAWKKHFFDTLRNRSSDDDLFFCVFAGDS